MPPRLQNDMMSLYARLAALLVITAGAAMMLVWHMRIDWLLTHVTWLFYMKHMTAMLFFFSGVSLLAAERKSEKLASFSAFFIFIFVALVGFEYIAGVKLGLDQWAVEDYAFPDTANPGRSSPNTVLAFLCISIALFCSSKEKWQGTGKIRFVVEFSGFSIFALGAQSLAGHISNAVDVFSWGSDTRMSLHTALCNMLIGSGIVTLSWSRSMMQTSFKPLVLTSILCVLVLIADIMSPPGILASLAYMPLVLCAIWLPDSRMAYIFAGMASVLAISGLFAHRAADIGPEALVNLGLVLCIIWATAFILHQRMRTETQLNRVDRHLGAIIKNTIEGIVTIDRDGLITSFNEACETIFGYEAREVLGQNVKMLMPEPYHNQHDGYLSRYRETGKGKIIGEPREVAACRKDGRIFPISLSVTEISVGEESVISGVIRDLTEAKKKEEYETQLGKILDNGLIEFYICDTESLHFITANEAALSNLGYAEDEIIRMTPVDLKEEFDLDTYRERFVTPLLKGEKDVVEFDSRHRRRNGSYYDVMVILQRVLLNGKPVLMTVIQDITERKRAEEKLLQSNKELEHFAYVASHDLKAPVRGIGQIARWLAEDLEGKLTEENIKDMNLLKSRVQRLETLLNDLLDYSRIGRKDADFEKTVLTAKELAEEVWELQGRPENFELLLSPELASVHVKKMPLQQIFMNLIGNAVKHHDKDRGHIEIAVEPVGETWRFTISDDGPGIEADYHKRVFEMFQTLKPRDEVEGSGMGLALVKKILMEQNCDITLESDGRGSRFVFTWPHVSILAKTGEDPQD